MRKLSIFILFMLLFSSVSLAQPEDEVDPDSLSNFVKDATTELKEEGETFLQAFETAGGTIPVVFDSVYSAFDPGYCGDDWIDYHGGLVFMAWLWPAIIVAMIIFFGIAILYMGAQLLQSPQLLAIAKDELWQSIMTVIRVMFIAVSVLTANTIYTLAAAGTTGDPVYDNSEDMLDAAMGFSRLMVVEMIDSYGLLVVYNMVVHTIYSSTMWVGVSFRAMYNFNLGPVLKPLIDIIGTALQYLSLAISEWMVHIITLCFIKRWTWGLLVPVGMLLRAVPQTRNAGEALLMLILALSILYPFMFLFDYEAHKIMSGYLVESSDGLNSLIAKSGIFAIGGAVVVIALLAGGVIFPFFFGGAITVAFELVRTSIYYIVMMGMLLPFLNIFVTLTLAREWGRIFNVNVNYLSFLKVI